LEEPENGIHPERIPAMLRLLSDLAVDVDEPVGSDNPLRQVIINTHSPAVVGQVDDDQLVVAESAEILKEGKQFSGVKFSWLPDTWRAAADDNPRNIVARGTLLSYLNPVLPEESNRHLPLVPQTRPRRRRVVDRPDIQPYLWPESMLESVDQGTD
jgi:hypothetical protein